MTTRSSSSPSPPTSMNRSRKGCVRKCERACCSVVTYFPLAFVYGLTTWAVWVVAGVGVGSSGSRFNGIVSSPLCIVLYVLLNWSYTTAVFTDPGSPLTFSGTTGYSHFPTQELPNLNAPSVTVKSTGETRYCKKCQARKPDRSHHCSTCRRCVLKMDHHCPWLATCVGLKNYKAFLLFLIYTSIYCWICFTITTMWLWSEVFSESQYTESLMPINYVLLCVISGIIGLVLTGFTIWHLSLACRGQTTIECLEKTRYLSPLRKIMRKQHFGHQNGVAGQGYGQQLAEIHANALPGVTRPEEGELMLGHGDIEEGRQSRPERSLHRDYNDIERSRERDRYEDYLDEQDSEKLPSAFDLGWRRNLAHLFGDRLILRFLPICNTTGDGWHWESNPKWIEAREAIRRERERKWQEYDDGGGGYEDGHHLHDRYVAQKWSSEVAPERHYVSISNSPVTAPVSENRSPGKIDIPWSSEERYEPNYEAGRPSSRMSMKTLRRRESFSDSSGDDDDDVEAP